MTYNEIRAVLDKWLDADAKDQVAGGMYNASEFEVARAVTHLRELREQYIKECDAGATPESLSAMHNKIVDAVVVLARSEDTKCKARAAQEEASAVIHACEREFLSIAQFREYATRYTLYRRRVWYADTSTVRLVEESHTTAVPEVKA